MDIIIHAPHSSIFILNHTGSLGSTVDKCIIYFDKELNLIFHTCSTVPSSCKKNAFKFINGNGPESIHDYCSTIDIEIPTQPNRPTRLFR